MGIGGIWLSLRTRMPVSVAWSTPGERLLYAISPACITAPEHPGEHADGGPLPAAF